MSVCQAVCLPVSILPFLSWPFTEGAFQNIMHAFTIELQAIVSTRSRTRTYDLQLTSRQTTGSSNGKISRISPNVILPEQSETSDQQLV